MKTTDGELHRMVLHALESDPSLDDQEIGIAVRGGVLTLSGYLESEAHARTIERLVARVPGVSAVVRTARICGARERCRSDTAIARTVVDRLAQRLGYFENGPVAKVEHGWVTLEGEVDLVRERADAEETIRRLPGVRGVSNCLTIRPPETVPRIQAKIEAALSRIARPMAALPAAEPGTAGASLPARDTSSGVGQTVDVDASHWKGSDDVRSIS
ncbi:MAG: BON domain-containing protein [Gemmatimonadales bacterium]